jgi:hypothetical protein
LLPDWVLSFQPPNTLEFLLSPGHVTGLIGVSVGLGGHIEARGKNRDFVEQQAAAFVRKIAPFWQRPIAARLTRTAESGPSHSGPLRPAVDRPITLTFDGPARVIDGNSMRQLPHDRPARAP